MFFEQLHPILSSPGMKIVGKTLTGILKSSIKIDFNKDGNTDVNWTPTISDLNLPLKLKGLDKSILVFDDLERCSISPEKVLGYINQFIEHQEQKVIIIANENDIINNEKNKRYSAIKEKVIGKSFDYSPDVADALDVFLTEGQKTSIHKHLKSKNQLIIELYNQSQYENLRHLRQALIDFERFSTFLPDKVYQRDELIEHLLSLFLIISFELKRGVITENEIEKLLYSSIEKAIKKEEKENDKLRNKYPILNNMYLPLDSNLWKHYFKYGSLDLKKVEESITNSIYFEEENTPEWLKLWRYWALEDNEFEEIFTSLSNQLEKGQIEDPFVVIHIVGIFSSLSNNGLINQPIKEIFELGKKQIDILKSNHTLNSIVFSDSKYNDAYGFQYLNKHQTELHELITYLKIKINESQIEQYPDIARQLLNLLKENTTEFKERLNSALYTPSLFNIPVLAHINPSEFVDILCSISNKNKRLAWDAIKERYGPVASFNLLLEKEWLIKVRKILKSKLTAENNLLSHQILQHLHETTFKDAIEQLNITKRSNE